MVDVIVIGGGIAGASVAAAIAPDCEVTLLEAEQQTGCHATGRSAAVFVPNYGTGPIRELSRRSRMFFDSPDSGFSDAPLLAPRGLLRVVRPEGREAYEKAMAGSHGIEEISLEEAAMRFPLLNPAHFVAASLEADVHDIDVDALLQGYIRAARRCGAMIMTEARVERIRRRRGAWMVETPRGAFDASILVNAAGAWADAVAIAADIRPLGLKPYRRSVAQLPLPRSCRTEPRPPFAVPFPLRWFAKAERSCLLVSTAEEVMVEPHDAFADDLTLAEGLHRFESDTRHRVDRLRGSWAGLRTFSEDGLPVIGFDPRAPEFFWFAGQGGSGIQTAPALAELGARLLLGANPESGLAHLFDPGRFR